MFGDLLGNDTILFHREATSDDSSMESQSVQQSQLWFESIWQSVARDYEE